MNEVGTEVVQCLMEAGYLATGMGMHREAETIFMGIQAARPDSEYPQIGWSVVRMNAGLHDDAIGILRNVADQMPDSYITRAYLGLALKLGGRASESETVLRQVLESNADPAAYAMAEGLLSAAEE